jgi:hypothetical protein
MQPSAMVAQRAFLLILIATIVPTFTIFLL